MPENTIRSGWDPEQESFTLAVSFDRDIIADEDCYYYVIPGDVDYDEMDDYSSFLESLPQVKVVAAANEEILIEGIHKDDEVHIVHIPAPCGYSVREVPPEPAECWLEPVVVPDDETQTIGVDEVDTVVVTNSYPVYTVELLKVGNGDENRVLAGAEFALYGDDYDPENPDATEPLLRTDPTSDDGLVELSKQLIPGTYYLVETVAPSGYVAAGAVRIVVTAEGVSYYQDETSLDETQRNAAREILIDEQTNTIVYRLLIDNFSGVSLPNTGGSGTQALAQGGLALMATALAGLFLPRRKKKGNGAS